MTESQASIIRLSERRASQLRYGRGSVERIVDATIGAGSVDLHVNRIRSGSAPGPYHLHTSSENAYLVVAGDVVVRIAGKDYRLGPGDAAFIPPGVPHSASNVGQTDAELIEIYAPADVDFVEITESDASTETEGNARARGDLNDG